MNSTEECDLCKKTFKNCYQLKRHKREVHGVKSTKENVKCIEEECNLVFSSICDLRAHLTMIHNQNSNTKEILCFVGKEEFHKWLANEERKTKTSFILTRGIKKFKNYSLYTYGCNRSGIYKSKGKGERQLKAQGSCKLGYHCTAQIILRVYSDHAEATYFSWHYRHDFLLGHVPIPAASKQNIAGKLAMGVEPSRILKDLKAISGDGIQKEHILRRKDISNIRNEFEIPAAGIGFTYGDDFQSVKAWVSTMQNKCVLLFKEQGSPHESIPSDDFMLVIMTESQKEMFKTFGWDRICIDSTYGVTGYGFELVTLMIVDEFEEGYPVAFCCCSTVNTSTMTVFLACIKAEVGEIAANVFMSDDTPIFYNAWMNVFGHAEMRLLCAWHVDHAWQGHLNCIIDVEKRKKIYAALKATLYELNKEKFTQMFNNLISDLLDDAEDTKKFGLYLNAHYSNRVESWAYCFRIGAKINTNMHLEAFHKVIKHIYLQGKKSRRMDKCVSALMDYLQDKEYDRLLKIHKGKITSKVSTALRRHNESKNIPTGKISEEEWRVRSSNQNTTYTVLKNHTHTCTEACLILCRFCNCCIAAYSCTCPDYLILNNLCKHIHACLSSRECQDIYSGPLCMAVSHISDETTVQVEEETGSSSTCNKSTDFIKHKLANLIGICESQKCLPSPLYTSVIKHLNAIEKLFDVSNNMNETLDIKCPNKEPANKKNCSTKTFLCNKTSKREKIKTRPTIN